MGACYGNAYPHLLRGVWSGSASASASALHVHCIGISWGTACAQHGHCMGTCMGHCVLARVHLTLVWYATSPLGAARGGNPRVNVSLCVRPVHHACTRACALQVTLDHAACLALCASCANCRFTSVSRAHRQHGQTPPRSRLASYAPMRPPPTIPEARQLARGCCPGPCEGSLQDVGAEE